MSELKATPGPWYAYPRLEPHGGCLSRLIAGVDSYVAEILFDDEVDATAEANAHLIAAAPDLYAALERLLKHACIADAAPEDVDGEDHIAESRARAALAKARGES